MEKLIRWNRIFVIKIAFRAPLILLIMLIAFRSASQENQPIQSTSSFVRDTVLMNKYMDTGARAPISPDSGYKYYSKALVLAKKHNLKWEIGSIWYSMGGKMLQKKDFPGCKRYLDSAFALNEELQDAELACLLNTQMAAMCQYETKYAKAASYYFRAVQVVKEHEIKNQRAVAILYNNLGGLMIAFHEDSLARTYLLLARHHVLRMHRVDSVMLLNILLVLGDLQPKADSFAAINYFKQANAIASKLNDVSSSYQTQINLSRSYIRREQYDSATYYLNRAKAIARPVWLVSTEVVAGILAFNKNDYAAAEKHLLNAIAHGDEGYAEMDLVYDALSDVYAARGKYQKAYTFQKKYIDQYKLFTNESKKTVTDLMLSFQALEHEKTILLKQAEISKREAAVKRQRFLVAVMCMVSLLLGIILVLAYRNYQHKKSLLNEQMRSLVQDQEIERLKSEAEGADNERSRIAYDIHDGVLVRLANVKMNIAGLAPTIPAFAESERYKDVIGQLDTATRELRNTAHNLMPEILLKEGMAQAIFYFCKATEQASGLNIKFLQIGDSFPRLQAHVEMAIYRIVQGLVQNIIQHANATTALVQLQYADYLCSITVEDNGKGMTDMQKDEGYGIKSIRNRIKILRGTIDIDSNAGQGTTVYLEFDARPFLLESQTSR